MLGTALEGRESVTRPTQVVGIDLGTTYSAIALVQPSGTAELLHNRDGGNITPSVVLFDGPEVVVGVQAKHQASAFPLDTVQFVKRQMGNPDFRFLPESSDTEYRPEEISAFILRYLIADARNATGQHVTDAVITVPAYFDEAQRTATRQAGEIAGINVVGIVNEPTAAAVSFGLSSHFRGNLLVFDLGGGTLDVTLMRCGGGQFDVLAVGGDRNLGGYDFDNAIILWARAQFVRQGGTAFDEDSPEGAQLRERAEDAKRRLSSTQSASMFVSSGTASAKLTLTRDEFAALSRHLLVRCEYLLEEVVDSAGLTFADVDKVLLVGGSTRIPMIRELVERVSGLVPDTSIHPDEAVALGAAMLGELRRADATGQAPALRHGSAVAVRDVVAHGLGVVADNEQSMPSNCIVVWPNTPIPCQIVADHFSTVVDGQRSLMLQVTEGDEDGVDPRFVRILGTSELKLRGRPAHSPIRIVFSCDLDGILHIEVVDLVDGANLGEMEIERAANLTDDEVARTREDLVWTKVR